MAELFRLVKYYHLSRFIQKNGQNHTTVATVVPPRALEQAAEAGQRSDDSDAAAKAAATKR